MCAKGQTLKKIYYFTFTANFITNEMSNQMWKLFFLLKTKNYRFENDLYFLKPDGFSFENDRFFNFKAFF